MCYKAAGVLQQGKQPMNQHVMRLPAQEAARFSRAEPPISREEAFARFDTLRVEMARVNLQLRNWTPDEFQTDDEYDIWKSAAITAQAYMWAERQFLEEWLEVPPSKIAAMPSREDA